jgi:hypothetical protein
VQDAGLAAEVAGRPAHADRGQPGTGDLDARRDRLECGDDRFEDPRLGGFVAR